MTLTRHPSSFRRSMEAVRSGSHDAVWDLIERYGPDILRVVRRRMNYRLRSRFDSADFVQMVWASFFRHPSQLVTFDGPNELTSFLLAMARNKVVQQQRNSGTRGRDLSREATQVEQMDSDNAPDHTQDTPSQIAIAREKWDRLTHELPEKKLLVIRLRLRGVTYTEIARILEMNERTVRRIIDELIEGGYDVDDV